MVEPWMEHTHENKNFPQIPIARQIGGDAEVVWFCCNDGDAGPGPEDLIQVSAYHNAPAGLWDHQGLSIDPALLPISESLRRRLQRWRKWSIDDLPDHRLAAARNAASTAMAFTLIDAFTAEGIAIARCLKSELGEMLVVYSFPDQEAQGVMGTFDLVIDDTDPPALMIQ